MTKMLTQRTVESAKPKAKRYGISDGLVPGHRLIVFPSGEKTYALFTHIHGKLVNLKNGNTAVLGLAKAREAARAELPRSPPARIRARASRKRLPRKRSGLWRSGSSTAMPRPITAAGARPKG